MKQTRKISISDKVFIIEDIKRLAAILEHQSQLAKRSDHQAFVEYTVIFSDDTTFQSDSSDLFLNESIIRPARPVEIRMSFRNFKLERSISLSLSHGNSSFSNSVLVSANESDWLSQNFLTITEAIQTVRPQTVWIRKCDILLLNLIALGIGNLMWLVMVLLIHGSLTVGILKPIPINPAWEKTISDMAPVLPYLKWLWYWFMGSFWGAFAVHNWLLSVWPRIEFNFGLLHLQTERIKRDRLIAVATLIVIPIIGNFIYDAIKSRF